MFCRVCKIKDILSVIHYTICGAVCCQFTHLPCDDWENIYICLIIIIIYWPQISNPNILFCKLLITMPRNIRRVALLLDMNL